MDEIIMDGLRMPEVSVTFTNITQGELHNADSGFPEGEHQNSQTPELYKGNSKVH